MRPPQQSDATLRAGWRLPAPRIAMPRTRLARPSAPGIRGRLTLVAVAGMAVSLVGVSMEKALAPGPTPARAPQMAGTSFLQTTTCADWQAAGAGRRMVIVRALAVAATRPDPENPGATLSNGAAYGLLQRVCSTPESRSTLLYESYNRAASFGPLSAGSAAASGGVGQR